MEREKNYFDYKNNGMSLGGEMPYGGSSILPVGMMDSTKTGEMPYGVMASDMNQPQPYGMMAPQESYGVMAPQQPYGGMDMSQPYGGGSILPAGMMDFAKTGEMDTSTFEPTDDSPLPNFDKYRDRGLEAGKMYRDVSGDGMNIAQMRQLSQRGQPKYQDFMGGGSGYQGLPYGLLGG